ncbi:MAG: type II toxin-antitoxin system VapC family toxin [Candidatus Binataceae bacterium]|nr:type II toxin-antitoxin system VapC family toxin [Candidatus Binataceae bacterium]
MAVQWAYFDTSVLVKRYVREENSREARARLRKHRVLSCAIAPAEAISAVCRRRLSGDLDEKSFKAIIGRLESDRDYWELVELKPDLLERAEDVIQSAGARTLDAIHIAAALTVREMIGLRLLFITADQAQAEAARRMRLEVVVLA